MSPRTTPSTAVMAWVRAHPDLASYDTRAIVDELGLTLAPHELSDMSLFVCHLVSKQRPAQRVEVYLSTGEHRPSCPRCYMPVTSDEARCPYAPCGIVLSAAEPARVAS